LIEIYTDGGCSGNPGPGGWAYVVIQTFDTRTDEGKLADNSPSPTLLEEKWGAEKFTTNNRMELMAVIAALEALPLLLKSFAPDEKISVYTDSQYVQKGITTWIKDWKTRGWKTASKTPVKNQDLWERLDALAAAFSPGWVWVKGHAGNEFNERCDTLTQIAIASI